MLRGCFEVGICGQSAFLTAIEAKLTAQEKLRVRWLGDTLEEGLWESRMLSPHAILFANSDASPAALATLLQEHSGSKLIGLEPERGTVTIFSSRVQTVSSSEELVQVILQALAGQAVNPWK